MEYIGIIIALIITLALLILGLQIKIKHIKELKKLGFDKELNKLTDKFPDNEEIAKNILKQLNKEDVIVKQSEDKQSKTSFYFVMTNTISIANINDTFTRIQTVAHECVHSTQNKRILWFNFIFSNCYMLYFWLISIMTLLNWVKNPMLQVVILILLGFIYYVIRSYLEIDAMTKARYVAKEYMENSTLVEKETIDKIIENYDEINRKGIKLANFQLVSTTIIRVIVFCILTCI